MKNVASDDSIQTPSEEARYWHHEYHVASAISSDADRARSLFNDAIKDAKKEGVDVSSVGSVKDVKTLRFDKSAFRKAEPALWAECSVMKITATFSAGRANEAAKTDTRTNDAAAYIGALTRAVEDLKRGLLDFDEVSQIDFAVLAATNFYGKEKELARLHLQAICGTSREIEGILKWERRSESVFDIETFKSRYPEIHRKFLTETDQARVDRDRTGQAD